MRKSEGAAFFEAGPVVLSLYGNDQLAGDAGIKIEPVAGFAQPPWPGIVSTREPWMRCLISPWNQRDAVKAGYGFSGAAMSDFSRTPTAISGKSRIIPRFHCRATAN